MSTEEGLVPIEDIKEGDLVWSQNPETGEIKLKKVEQLFINKSDTILRINIAGEIIEATEQHVFYIDNVGWIPANMIEEGDVVVLQSGERAIVEDIDKIVYDEPITVYNFEVEDFHTYFVSNVNVLVHNRCDINAKKSNNHSRTNKNPGPRGERNSSVDILDDDGNVKTRRWYDGDGRADRDVDFTDHGNPKQHPKVPHEHKWDWKSGKPKRR